MKYSPVIKEECASNHSGFLGKDSVEAKYLLQGKRGARLSGVLYNSYFDGEFSVFKTFEAVSLRTVGNSWLLGTIQG